MVGMMWEGIQAPAGDVLGAIVADAGLTILQVSPGALEAGRYAEDELVGRNVVDIVHPDDLGRAADVLDELRYTVGVRAAGMYRLVLGDGTHRQFAVRANNREEDIVFEFSEPTPHIRAEAFADDAVDAMRMLSEDMSLEDSFDWVARVAERHVFDLQIVVTMLESDGPNLVVSRRPLPTELAEANQAATKDELPSHVQAAVEEARGRTSRASSRIASLDGELPGRLTSPLRDRSGELVGYIEALRPSAAVPDDSEWLVHGMISRMMTAALHRHEFDTQLRLAADHDHLTGLINRRKLFELLESNEHLAGSVLFVIDLDQFSWINNNLGHQAGDEVLIAVAQSLRVACPEHGFVARLGGDEFVVFVPNGTSGPLEELGALLCEGLVMPVGSSDRRRVLRSSIGMVRIEEGEAPADALARADTAMYVSKREGGNAATEG